MSGEVHATCCVLHCVELSVACVDDQTGAQTDLAAGTIRSSGQWNMANVIRHVHSLRGCSNCTQPAYSAAKKAEALILGEDFVTLEWRLPEDAVQQTPHKTAKMNSALVGVTSVSNLRVVVFCAGCS